MLTQPWKLQCSSWSGSKARPNMVPTWAWHGPKNRNSKEMGLRPCRSSVENFRALAGLEVKLGQSWSKNGPYMVPNNSTLQGTVLLVFHGFTFKSFLTDDFTLPSLLKLFWNFRLKYWMILKMRPNLVSLLVVHIWFIMPCIYWLA